MNKIFFKEKPTTEQVARYETGLRYYLQHQRAEVKVVVGEEPLRIESYLNGVHDDTTYHWIEHFHVKTPEIEFDIDNPFREGISEDSLLEGHLWNDAFYIQDRIYQKLGRQPGSPKDDKDPYWKLWDLRR